jgi:hypothetical protein
MEARPQLTLVELAVAATAGFVGLNAVEGGWPACLGWAGQDGCGSTVPGGERPRLAKQRGSPQRRKPLDGEPARGLMVGDTGFEPVTSTV